MLKMAFQNSGTTLNCIYRFSSMMTGAKSINAVVAELEKFAPVKLAEKWDNVGLLIEPTHQHPVKNIMLTNDLTERVMIEAIEKHTNLIISYHPPIFAPLKRITQSNWKERIIALCLSQSIALYSPHTAWDAVVGGVNDWLVSALPASNVRAIQECALPGFPAGTGGGRMFTTQAMTLGDAINRLQKHIGDDVHVAMAVSHKLDSRIEKVAVCAGSGGQLLRNVSADLYITGEMSHHDILDANHNHVSVLLCNHSNSERGFLRDFQHTLSKLLNNDCNIYVSEEDKDPLNTFEYI